MSVSAKSSGGFRLRAGFGLILLVVLLVLNIVLNPARFSPVVWGSTLIGLAAPLLARRDGAYPRRSWAAAAVSTFRSAR